MSLLVKLKSLNRERVERRRAGRVAVEALQSKADVVVSTPPHCAYIARCIQIALGEVGLKCYINMSGSIPPVKDGGAHIVICPQLYDDLPPGYIAYQMEQTLSSSWFNESYVKKLADAAVILDYSKSNVEELAKIFSNKKHIFYGPIPLLRQVNVPHVDKEFDVAFYGNITGSSRREHFLDVLSSRFRVNSIHGKHGDDLYRSLRAANLVVNIHYYENAPLESTRIMECLSLGLPVVSESSRDIEAYPGVENFVAFVPEGGIGDMVEKIDGILSGGLISNDTALSAEAEGLFYNEFKSALFGALRPKGAG